MITPKQREVGHLTGWNIHRKMVERDPTKWIDDVVDGFRESYTYFSRFHGTIRRSSGILVTVLN